MIKKLERGQISAILIIFIGILFALIFFKGKSPSSSSVTSLTTTSTPCAPVKDIAASEISAPAYPPKESPNATEPKVPYRLVRKDVPINVEFYTEQDHYVLKMPNFNIGGTGFNLYYPNPDDEDYPDGPGEIAWPQGLISKYRHPNETRDKLYFTDFRLIFAVQLKGGQPIASGGLDQGSKPATFWLTDIYQNVAETNQFPSDAFVCQQSAAQTGQDTQVSFEIPTEGKSQDHKQLQLEYFIPQLKTSSGAITSSGGWSTQCKPAIYLYPQKVTQVNVKVKTKGFLTYTDPKYPEGGWDVLAFPDGKLEYSMNDEPQTLNYLYYESKVPDELIDKPKDGYIVEYGKLSEFYDLLLPKLGLDSTQTKDFKEYWIKALPYSLYYFVGIISHEEIDAAEPLEITPQPDTTIRVRLYFQALNKKEDLSLPPINTPQRQGFTMVEWGGMIKIDPNKPFTCSQ